MAMKYRWNFLSSIEALVVHKISSPHTNINLTNKDSLHDYALIAKY